MSLLCVRDRCVYAIVGYKSSSADFVEAYVVGASLEKKKKINKNGK